MIRPPIVSADPKYRKKVLRIVLLASIAGFALLALLIPPLEKASTHADPARTLATMKIALAILLLIPVLLMIVIIRIAVKTIKQKQFPPEGMQVLRDTTILYDGDATKRGIILLILAFLIIDFCFAAAFIAMKLLSSLPLKSLS